MCIVAGVSLVLLRGHRDRGGRERARDRFFSEIVGSPEELPKPADPRPSPGPRRDERLWIQGRVLGPAGAPAARASVAVFRRDERGVQDDPSAECVSDDTGAFVLEVASRGQYVLVARRGTLLEARFGVGAGARDVEIRLKEGGRVRVHVKDARGKPIRDARLRIKGFPAVQAPVRDAEAWVVGGLMRRRTYVVKAEHPEFQPTADYISLDSDQAERELELELIRGSRMSVRFVVGKGSRPAPPFLRAQQGSRMLSPERTEDPVRVVFETLAPTAPLLLQYGWRRTDPVLHEVQVVDGGEAVIELDEPGSVSVHRVRPGMEPRLSARGRLFEAERDGERWFFSLLWPGDYELRMLQAGECSNSFAPAKAIHVAAGRQLEVEAPSVGGTGVNGRFRRPPECTARLTVRIVSGERGAVARIDPDGTFRFSGVPGASEAARMEISAEDGTLLFVTDDLHDALRHTIRAAVDHGRVHGVVRAPDGRAVSGARVRIEASTNGIWIRRAVLTAPDGTFEFQGTGDSGVMDVTARAPGYRAAVLRRAPTGEAIELRLRG